VAYKILYPDAKHRELDIEAGAVGSDATLLNPRQDRFEAIDQADWESCDALVVSRMPIDQQVIAHLKRCRIVVRNGVGFDVLDLAGLGEAGIAACNVPDYGTTEVADSAIAMMLCFARGTAAMDAALRADLSGNWTHERNVTARRLRCVRAPSACASSSTIRYCLRGTSSAWASSARASSRTCWARRT
jgi:lactate dehydrogenase-like 2-hydroxyacid dehydrogenase